MKFRTAFRHLEGIPHISKSSARVLYSFVRRNQPEHCLELGFAHGASSNYIAAALEENGRGRLTSVDLDISRSFEPTIEAVVARTGLQNWISIQREVDSYNWFLKKKIDERSEEHSCAPIYDFCFIDGSKNWTVDGFAFFLVDKLLRPGGWLLFDDYGWSYAAREAQTGRRATDGLCHSSLSQDQRRQPNVQAIFHRLVVQHPDYSNFIVQDRSWAWARKTPGQKLVSYERKRRFKSRIPS